MLLAVTLWFACAGEDPVPPGNDGAVNGEPEPTRPRRRPTGRSPSAAWCSTAGLVGTAPSDRAIRAMDDRAGALRLTVVKNDRQLLYDGWGERALHRLDSDLAGLVDVYDPADPDVIALWQEMDVWADELHQAWDHLPPPTAAGPRGRAR